MYGLKVITPPTIEPVTLPEVRGQCRVDEVGDDPTLAGYVHLHLGSAPGAAAAFVGACRDYRLERGRP